MSYGQKLFLKVILAGEAEVGKTSLRRSYLGEGFVKNHLQTIGADFASLSKTIKDYNVLFQIWDVAGQDIFENVRMLYYKGTLGALMVFDATKIVTFRALNRWIEELEKGTERGIVPFFILGNKMDLVTSAKKAKLKAIIITINRIPPSNKSPRFGVTSIPITKSLIVCKIIAACNPYLKKA
ncbi:unnamed protein product [marine sediment metagenome]|uniref:GTP-binding protein n=1 Tax=marine sediment metagenome TaxID=412755 RepID=X1FDK5_9ZZZZ